MSLTAKIPRAALPASDEERLDWLQLARSRRVGPVTFIRLLREHGSAAAALAALPEIARAANVENYAAFPRDEARREYETGLKSGARLLCLGAPDYPPLLALIPDPPPLLWSIGDRALAARDCIALVGARNASSLGLRMAAALARDLSGHGFTVVSGLARGIDAAAHRAALDGGTIAVQAGGVDTIYPRENAELSEKIAKSGLRLSEMPIGITPQARHFPRRNRLISGLSRALVVIEGASRSGSLITARDALDQGREVMAVPGNPFDARAAGCNMLIRDGATLVRSADDIIAALAPAEPEPHPAPPPAPPPPGGDLAARVLSLLGPTPIPEDMLIRETGHPSAAVLSTLVDLEIAQKITRAEGGTVALQTRDPAA